MTMTPTGYAHIVLKPSGTAMIAGTRVSVARIALDHTLYGYRPEEIAQHYEGLALGEVFSALAYYYDHKEEMDRRIKERKKRLEVLRGDFADSHAETLARLKAKGLRH